MAQNTEKTMDWAVLVNQADPKRKVAKEPGYAFSSGRVYPRTRDEYSWIDPDQLPQE
jgi:hypothetical protein